MRNIPQKITVRHGYNAYCISNAYAMWDDIAIERSNFSVPAVRINLELSETSEEELQECFYMAPVDEGEDPIIEEHYIDAILGRLDGWKLIAVGVSAGGVSMLVACESTGQYHYLWIEAATASLNLMFETTDQNGNVSQYLLEMRVKNPSSQTRYADFLCITETDVQGKRQIYLQFYDWFEVRSDDPDWDYALMVEYR